MTTRGEWAQEQLAFGDWPITREKLIGMVAWAVAEGSPCNCNPLDDTQPAPGASNCNQVGVKNYPSLQVGIEAVYVTLHNGLYPGVLAVLNDEGSSAMSLAQAVGRSPWGTGDFSRVVEDVKADYPRYANVEVVGSGPDPAPPEPAPIPPQREGDMASIAFAPDGKSHIVYEAKDGHVIELVEDGIHPQSMTVYDQTQDAINSGQQVPLAHTQP